MAGEMAQLLEALAGLPEDPVLFLIPTGPLTAVYSSSSKGPDAKHISGTQIYMQVNSHTHKK